MPEAKFARQKPGKAPRGEGWYVLNARETLWAHSDALGSYCTFEGSARFPEVGFNLNVLQPGQPNAMYHAEDAQEGFLVLSGECLLIVEEQERLMRAWDFFHCPAGTAHVLVATGEQPCIFVAFGARGAERSIRYPVSELAQAHDAGLARETSSPRSAYRKLPPTRYGKAYRSGDLPDV